MSGVSLIDGHIDEAKKTCKDCLHYVVCEALWQNNGISKIPPKQCGCFKNNSDVVEVVRCKDCKWYQEGKLLAPNKFCFRLEHPTEDRKIGYNYAPDDFCSYGERRGKEECEDI